MMVHYVWTLLLPFGAQANAFLVTPVERRPGVLNRQPPTVLLVTGTSSVAVSHYFN